jgi:RNA recognition motif-containing protein
LIEQHQGFAFFEYVDPEVTDKACSTLNGMELQGKTLQVQRAYLGAKSSGGMGHTMSPAGMPTISASSIQSMLLRAAVVLGGKY